MSRELPAPTGFPEPLPAAAFIGPLGRLVRVAAPTTEASPDTLFVTALVFAGASISAHIKLGETEPARLYALVAGSQSSRKGTSASIVRSWFHRAGCLPPVISGVSTAEGLLAALVDLAAEAATPTPAGEPRPGRAALAIEEEAAALFARKGREGSVLSPMLRDLWSREDAGITRKTDPISVQGARLSLLMHGTPAELSKIVTTSDIGGGLLGRMLVVPARRVRCQFGAMPEPEGVGDALATLAVAMRDARGVCEAQFTARANEVMSAAYNWMGDADDAGVSGAILGRFASHATRVALIFACLEAGLAGGRGIIRADHALAGLEVARLGGDALRWMLGAVNTPENATAADVVAELRRAGQPMSKTEIRDIVFRNHVLAVDLDRALDYLRHVGAIGLEPARPGAKGRPAERWYLLDPEFHPAPARPWADAVAIARETAKTSTADDDRPVRDVERPFAGVGGVSW